MSNVSTATGETIHIQTPAIIKNIIITNESGGALGLSVFRYRDTGGRKFIRVICANNVTTPIIFEGVSFPDGFTIVPDTNLTFLLVEYVNLVQDKQASPVNPARD
jgi:hypothetical protein